jgi:hypothetical protein
MARSPIEMMVDQACGIAVDANGKISPMEKPALQDDAAVAKALERVANAAVAWHFARAEDRMTSAIARKLDGAAAKLAELGWR